MATLSFPGTAGNRVKINPISTAINNLPNGAGTVAYLLARTNTTTDDDVGGLRGGDLSGGYYHGFRMDNSASYDFYDDNTFTLSHFNMNITPTGTTGDDFYICGINWANGNVTERGHASSKISTAESWTNVDADAANGGTQAGPGTSTGFFLLGDYDSSPFLGLMGLVGIWGGVSFSDTDWTNLWVNKKTSDWWNHPAGQPSTLIELTSTSPTDIGSDPVSSITVTGVTATGADPTGWTFDGRGTVDTGLAWITA